MSSHIKRVLVVGLGSIGLRHVKLINDIDSNIEITLLRHKLCNDVDINKLKISHCVTSLEDALKHKPQASIIANPATKHLEIALPLAKKGIHLLIEKPIAEKADGIEDIIEYCDDNQLVLMTAYNLRFLPSLIEFRNELNSNRLGKILSVHAEVGQYLPSWRANTDYKESVSAQKKLGGGVLLELSHEIDYLIWLFGSVKWVKSHVTRQSNLDIDVEDTANVICGFSHNTNSNLVASLRMDFVRHDNTRECIVIGEEGTLKWDGIENQVKLYSRENRRWETIYEGKNDKDFTYREEINHFFQSIENKTNPLISGRDGLLVVRTIESILESHFSGKMVKMGRLD